MDEILWCYHSNETSSAVLSHAAIYFSAFYKIMKFGNFVAFLLLPLFGSEGLSTKHYYQLACYSA